MSPAKRQELDALLGRAGHDDPWTPGGFAATFGRAAPRLLDIGVGTGEATVAWAREHPERDVFAVEVHQPGLLRLLRTVEAEGLANLRAVEDDATAVVARTEPGSFDDIRILFPDPWPKRRHVRRRLVDPPFVHAATELLALGGRLHLATDWADYADQMRQSLTTDRRLTVETDRRHRLTEGEPERDPATWPHRPVTAYERRGGAAGRTITDLVARRTT